VFLCEFLDKFSAKCWSNKRRIMKVFLDVLSDNTYCGLVVLAVSGVYRNGSLRPIYRRWVTEYQ